VGDKQQVMIGDARTFPAANSDIIDEVRCGVAACSISVPGAARRGVVAVVGLEGQWTLQALALKNKKAAPTRSGFFNLS
jgi:hypothetical protein